MRYATLSLFAYPHTHSYIGVMLARGKVPPSGSLKKTSRPSMATTRLFSLQNVSKAPLTKAKVQPSFASAATLLSSSNKSILNNV